MKTLLILLITLFTTANALDLSSGNTQNIDITQNKNIEKSKNQSQSQNTNKSKTVSKAKTKSKSTTNTLNLDKLATITQTIINLENNNIYPFAQCKLFTQPRSLKNFDLSCNINGSFLENQCNYLNTLAKNQGAVQNASYFTEDNIKDYTRCGILYGAIITNYIKNEELTLNIKDSNIIAYFKALNNSLDNAQCRFNGEITKIICNELNIDISSQLKLSVANIGIFNDNNYLGYTISKKVDNTNTTEKRKSYEKRNEYSTQLQQSKTQKLDKSMAIKQSRETAQKLNISSFIKE